MADFLVDEAVLFAFIEVESAFNPRAFLNDRNGGSYGLMQLDYQTALDRGYKGDPIGLYAPLANVATGRKILRWIAAELASHGMEATLETVAAAYNSGLGHVLRGGTDAPYSDKIAAAHARWAAALAD
jgi:soluble lytic murein transglycosylase-like protein